MSAARRWSILAVCASAMFLVGLDTTIVNVALPEIGRGLTATTSGLQWVVDAYTVVFAGLLISAGALADRFGRRRVFLIGLTTFGLASVGCAVAPSLGSLIGFRVLQGVGASMLGPVALGIVVNAMPDPRERARAIGIWASVFGLSMATGPVLGGALTTAFGWRSVFWVVVPTAAAAIALVLWIVPESRPATGRRLDPPGQVLLIALIVGTVWVLIEAPELGWGSPPILTGYLVVALLLAGFARVESRRAYPVIDPRLFRHSGFAAAGIGALAVFVALNIVLFLITFYLQVAQDWSPLKAGAVSLPLAICATVCAPLAGHLVARIGARPPLYLASGAFAAGGVILLAAGSAPATTMLLCANALIGVGVGFANAPITNAAVNSLPRERAGVAGGITSSARQVGASLGIAVAGGLFTGHTPETLGAAMRPGWVIVVLCGLVLLAIGAAENPYRSKASTT
ncbi:MFS transporter [Kineosporia babensis]